MTKYLYSTIHMTHAKSAVVELVAERWEALSAFFSAPHRCIPLAWTDYTKSSIPSPPLTSSQ